MDRTGDLRFRQPEPYGPYSGVVDATKSGPSCTQLQPKVVIPEGLSPPAISYASGIHAASNDSEDCKCPPPPPGFVPDEGCALASGLTLDIIKPAVIGPNVKLPVAVVSACGP